MKKEDKVEEPFVGLLRGVGEVQEHLSSTAPKTNPLAGVLYYSELTLDTGRTYKHWSKRKDYLENLKVFIDTEVSGSTSGENIRLNVPSDYMDKFPREKKAPPKIQVTNSDTYWKDKADRDILTNAAIEQQYYISRACDFVIPLGRMTDGNWEELLDKAMEKGLELYKKYGRTSG
jgi:hypothetical protein